MTLAELRTAYNEACRNPRELERFALSIMPKVFWLLESIEKQEERTDFQSLPKTILNAARECRPAPKAPKKHQPERYTGGR